MSERELKVTKKERALLRQLMQQAWETELQAELENLYEQFCPWDDKGLSAFELSEKILEFHDGVSRELYNRYTNCEPIAAVSRAVALGIL